MKSRNVVVRCEYGLHARVAAKVVRQVQKHESAVHVYCDGCPRADACSILELMCLGACEGTHLQVVAEGPDENVVVDAVAGIFEQGDGI